MKLTKSQAKTQQECENILEKDILTLDEKMFVFENWHEGATNINSSAGAFFTPIGLARDFNLEVGDNMTVVDLCAGIGMLSFFAHHWHGCKVTCVEINGDYIRVGKKLLPEANWIRGSIIDEGFINSLGHFDQSISNPPFGKIKTGDDAKWLKYKGSEFEYRTIDVASGLSDFGTFIIPQTSTPFKYSGNHYMEKNESSKLDNFIKETGFDLEFNCGIDTGVYLGDWKGVSPLCEIINIEFQNIKDGKGELTLF